MDEVSTGSFIFLLQQDASFVQIFGTYSNYFGGPWFRSNPELSMPRVHVGSIRPCHSILVVIEADFRCSSILLSVF